MNFSILRGKGHSVHVRRGIIMHSNLPSLIIKIQIEAAVLDIRLLRLFRQSESENEAASLIFPNSGGKLSGGPERAQPRAEPHPACSLGGRSVQEDAKGVGAMR